MENLTGSEMILNLEMLREENQRLPKTDSPLQNALMNRKIEYQKVLKLLK